MPLEARAASSLKEEMAIDSNSPKTQKQSQVAGASVDRRERVRRDRPGLRKRVTDRDIIYFASQLSLMLEVGTSLTDAVRALEKQTTNPRLCQILEDLGRDMEEGQAFSAALSRHVDVFGGVFVSMVRAGETGGYLHDALDRVVEMREKRSALLAQVKTALTYPLILCVVSAGVIIFVLTGVFPKFMPLFAGKEDLLPITTRVLIAASQSLIQYWWAYALGLVGIIFCARIALRSPPGRLLCDRLTVSFPVVGVLANKIFTGQVLRTMGHLLESHVALTDALQVTRLTIRNQCYAQLIDRADATVRGGGRLSQAFLGFTHMPATVRQMLATGEEAGNIYPVMLRLAKHYDVEIEQELKRMSALVEPLALIVLGGMVGVIVASVILPMFKMAHAIG